MPDPVALSAHGWFVLILLVAAFWLYSRDRVPMALTSLGVISVLAAAFTLFPFRNADDRLVRAAVFFDGFGHEALVAICGLLILAHGLTVTGALEPVASLLARLWRWSRPLAFACLLLGCFALSGFINDTPIVVLMMPVLIALAQRTRTSAATTLMPMNFAVILGGMLTPFGTSTNLLVVSIAADLKAAQFGMFSFFGTAALAAIPGLLYLYLVAPRLLKHVPHTQIDVQARVYESSLSVPSGSPMHGLSLAQVLQALDREVQITHVDRRGIELARLPTLNLLEGDRLRLRGTADGLRALEKRFGVSHLDTGERPALQSTQQLAEVVIPHDSGLCGRQLDELDLHERRRISVLAAYRAGREGLAVQTLDHLQLAPGDVLLVQGTPADLDAARAEGEFLVLDGRTVLPHTHKAPIALLVMALVITCAALRWLPIAIAALLGVVSLLVTRVLTVDQLGRALKVEVVLLVAASLALGRALTETGGTHLIAGGLASLLEGAPPAVAPVVLLLTMSLLTNIVSNNAAAAIGTPIAVSLAHHLGVSPEPYVLAIMFGANLSFATPFGYQTNLLVMSAAGYRFKDFVRVGVPLTLIVVIGFAILLPLRHG